MIGLSAPGSACSAKRKVPSVAGSPPLGARGRASRATSRQHEREPCGCCKCWIGAVFHGASVKEPGPERKT